MCKFTKLKGALFPEQASPGYAPQNTIRVIALIPKGPCTYIMYTWALKLLYGNPSGELQAYTMVGPLYLPCQAAKEKRPFRVIVIGPSNTIGRGCSGHHLGNAKGLRWSDALQNLSNYTRSPPESPTFPRNPDTPYHPAAPDVNPIL